MPKRLLFVAFDIGIGSGGGKIARDQCTYLQNQGYKTVFLTTHQKKHEYELVGTTKVTLNEDKKSSFFKKLSNLFKRAKQIAAICEEHDIDTVINYGEEVSFSSILSKLFSKQKYQVISSIHIYRTPRYITNRFYYFLRQVLFPFSDYIITITQEQKHLLQRQLINHNKIKVIHNTLPIKEIREKMLEENFTEFEKELLQNDTFTFITIGRLAPQKNQKFMLAAFDTFHEKHPNSQLLIIGDGGLREQLLAYKKTLSAHDNIHFLGIQKNPYKFLYRSDCFLFTSLWEGFGLVLVEAMACELPVISFDCPSGPKEILGSPHGVSQAVKETTVTDYGILLPPTNNLSEAVTGMEMLYLEPELQKNLSMSGIERASKFSENTKTFKKLVQIIEE